jgi:hypothetical protein
MQEISDTAKRQVEEMMSRWSHSDSEEVENIPQSKWSRIQEIFSEQACHYYLKKIIFPAILVTSVIAGGAVLVWFEWFR